MAENLVSCSLLIGEVREFGGRKYVVYQLSVKPHPTALAPSYVEKTAFGAALQCNLGLSGMFEIADGLCLALNID